MKIVSIVLIALCIGFSVNSAHAVSQINSAATVADSNEDRVMATKDYLKVVPVENMAHDMLAEMMKNIPQEQQSEAEAVLKQALEPEFLESITLETMPKHFTTKEIKAMSKFYSSPEGVSILKKFGGYMADIMPAIQNQVMKAIQQRE